MKTIATGRQGSLFRTLFVLAALGGFYYFRRQGGSVTDLLSKGTQGLSSARNWMGSQGQNQSVSSSATI